MELSASVAVAVMVSSPAAVKVWVMAVALPASRDGLEPSPKLTDQLLTFSPADGVSDRL